MRGEYETIEVRNGKGYYSTKATTQGMKEWGGLIIMKTETGDKKYPFKGSYMVHKVEGIVSIDMMNKVFRGFDNPITDNQIGAEGATHLKLPANLQTLTLYSK